MQKIRHNWQQIPRIELPEGKLVRPISMLHRRLPPRAVVASHRHAWGQVVYASEGVLEVATPTGRYLLPPNRAAWVPPDHPHEVSSEFGAEMSSIHIDSDEAKVLAGSCYVLEVSPLLRELILEALRHPADYLWSGTAGRLFRTLRDQVASAAPVPLYLPIPQDSRLLKICSALQLHPESNRNLEQWSSEVGASSRTLQRLFLQQTGMNFRRWRQQLRLQIALQHLTLDRYSVTRIASELGYESCSAFIAMFQQQLGMTPGEYVKSLSKHSPDTKRHLAPTINP
ncbi:MAG: helix-turn-helix transcriptional regulator [Hahellaceae bacterium]|nr:helix-turn-helix transcriptional regulator [Hahellaceae bacterium]MCP5170172.1 helix-turn-helix transcriptional regulator [Hahellaceae bacterium]